MAGIGISLAARIANALNDTTHEAHILAEYLGFAGSHVGLGLLWLPFAAASTTVAGALVMLRWTPKRDAAAVLHPRFRSPLAAGGLALWMALPLLARLNLHLPDKHRGFWSPIRWRDLQALRQVEATIPPEDGVLVPAEHWNIGNLEHWVIPVGDTTALLPYGERRYLFDVYLGASYPLSWRDLEVRLCSSDRGVRAGFLARQRARWLLVRDPGARDDADAARRQRMCGEPLTSLGAELPAARAEGGIYLFRLGR